MSNFAPPEDQIFAGAAAVGASLTALANAAAIVDPRLENQAPAVGIGAAPNGADANVAQPPAGAPLAQPEAGITAAQREAMLIAAEVADSAIHALAHIARHATEALIQMANPPVNPPLNPPPAYTSSVASSVPSSPPSTIHGHFVDGRFVAIPSDGTLDNTLPFHPFDLLEPFESHPASPAPSFAYPPSIPSSPTSSAAAAASLLGSSPTIVPEDARMGLVLPSSRRCQVIERFFENALDQPVVTPSYTVAFGTIVTTPDVHTPAPFPMPPPGPTASNPAISVSSGSSAEGSGSESGSASPGPSRPSTPHSVIEISSDSSSQSSGSSSSSSGSSSGSIMGNRFPIYFVSPLAPSQGGAKKRGAQGDSGCGHESKRARREDDDAAM